MADDKLRQELFYMVRLTSKYDFTKMEVVESILRLENERQILCSVFGKRFKSRIFDIAAGSDSDSSCVICGNPAENHVICQHCIDTIGSSEYAKSKIKTKENENKGFAFKIPNIKLPKLSIPKLRLHKKEKELSIDRDKRFFNRIFSSRLKSCIQLVLTVCLIMILFIQIWIAVLWFSIPDFNPSEEPRNSEYPQVAVNSKDEAYDQLLLDFPEKEGYTLTYGRVDSEYVGRFLLDNGDCCQDVEEQLTDEEKYDYFFTEDVYIFYISYLEENTSKVGLAEINSNGAIIIEGSFNDGRKTDCFYKFR